MKCNDISFWTKNPIYKTKERRRNAIGTVIDLSVPPFEAPIPKHHAPKHATSIISLHQPLAGGGGGANKDAEYAIYHAKLAPASKFV